MNFSNNFNTIQNSYYEITRNGDLVTKETWYTTPDKLQKIREIEYTYTGDLISLVVSKQYNDFGFLIQTYTQTLTYINEELFSIAGELS